MPVLSSELRSQLSRVIVQARDVAEEGARAALEALAVHHHEPYGHMGVDQRTLRNRLRAHGRQLGDPRDPKAGTQGIGHLVQECAYEHWHRMLFARFLAENHLLMEPELGVAITLEECEHLAKEQSTDPWTLAGRFAQRMLPQVFRAGHPAFGVTFAREHRIKLEKLLEGLPAETFEATDALGWVYQFWQSKRKEEVNASEVKIGADELPAVTQLFTEPYMVRFLLHNSLGAWWVSRHPDSACPVKLTYLRTLEDGTPAAGTFPAWPDDLTEFKLLDPCCGSGHFLVAAFHLLVPMRMALEGVAAREAVDAVLRDNLHGLEIDRRCVEIAAFALALEAWRYPGAGEYRPLPSLNLAWCGQPVTGKREAWLELAGGDEDLRTGMMDLYDTFREAPLLGSLIDPRRAVRENLFTAGFDELQKTLEIALTEHQGEVEFEETAIAAKGLAVAAHLLGQRYHLVITNVPYLARGKQTDALKEFCAKRYANAKNDLANVFLERLLEMCSEGGVTQIVMPQNWLFLTSYKKQRERLLTRETWNLLVRLGAKGFQTPMWDFNVQLLTLTHARPDTGQQIHGLDVSEPRTAREKAAKLIADKVVAVGQRGQLGNPDARIALEETAEQSTLSKYADGLVGMQTSDDPMFVEAFWEQGSVDKATWEFLQATPDRFHGFDGWSWLVKWEQGNGLLLSLPTAYPTKGLKAVGRPGVAIHRMGTLFAYHYGKERFHQNVAVIVPKDEANLPAIWCFCSSSEYNEVVRQVDQSLKVTNATLVKVPFNLGHWQNVCTVTVIT
ncbi:MAG: BREX-1 system adenine-specific DNA-methyltransferase PglX [Nitrospirota bacterium]|nr:BREX-1 system adenine-specific DNA-methyltransferase PglX [Nitrospirota bacterium]